MGPITSANSFYRNLYQFFDELVIFGVDPCPAGWPISWPGSSLCSLL